MNTGAEASANDILWVARVCVDDVGKSSSAQRGEVGPDLARAQGH